jgi:tRNA-5-methyluridine54 2-sulfurtransferase
MAMRCKRCRDRATIEIRRHNAAFCRDCFFHYVRQQVTRAIDKHHMLRPDDRVLVAVSGGKDSLALWDLLLDLGYRADGLYMSLGIGGYSERSKDTCQAFADARGAKLVLYDLGAEQGYTIPEAAAKAGRAPRGGGRSSCGVCGLSKRYVFNRVALQGGYDVVATGHNLDDEAAVLLANTLRWDTATMARQFPVLEATRPGLVKKVKPLYRVAERETAAYCVLKGIDYVVEECPLVAGNTQLRHKETLNQMEEASPGTKHNFLFGFIDRAAELLASADDAELTECARCGMVTQAPEDPAAVPVCAFCRSRERLLGSGAGRQALPLVEVVGG